MENINFLLSYFLTHTYPPVLKKYAEPKTHLMKLKQHDRKSNASDSAR